MFGIFAVPQWSSSMRSSVAALGSFWRLRSMCLGIGVWLPSGRMAFRCRGGGLVPRGVEAPVDHTFTRKCGSSASRKSQVPSGLVRPDEDRHGNIRRDPRRRTDLDRMQKPRSRTDPQAGQ